MDAAALKEKERRTWTQVSPGWRKYDLELREFAAPVTARLIERAGIKSGSKVLDIASGTGEPAIPAALRVGAGGSVLGVDFVEEMLAFAREGGGQGRKRRVSQTGRGGARRPGGLLRRGHHALSGSCSCLDPPRA
jgi:ubiquinone/menaquinone biosynthesis C-methylase UbiE